MAVTELVRHAELVVRVGSQIRALEDMKRDALIRVRVLDPDPTAGQALSDLGRRLEKHLVELLRDGLKEQLACPSRLQARDTR